MMLQSGLPTRREYGDLSSWEKSYCVRFPITHRLRMSGSNTQGRSNTVRVGAFFMARLLNACSHSTITWIVHPGLNFSNWTFAKIRTI
jgi:hypothetical protein